MVESVAEVGGMDHAGRRRKNAARKRFAGPAGVSGQWRRRRCEVTGKWRGKLGRGVEKLELATFVVAEILRSSLADALRMTNYCGCWLSFLVATCFVGYPAMAQVTSQRLLNAGQEPQNWMMYSGDYSGRRYSSLQEIKVENADKLVPKWAYQTMAGGKFETTPLVVEGIMYGTGQDDRAFALDARTGRPIWQYQRNLPGDIRPCCGRVNRGLAILGGKVFMGTLDSHVIALDATTGNVVWDVASVDYTKGYSYTLAPLVIKNLVLVGISGGEYGIRRIVAKAARAITCIPIHCWHWIPTPEN